MSEVISQGACADCGSSDACTLYTDGHTHCFSCGAHHGTQAESGPDLEFKALPRRKISETTCRFWGYGISGDTHVMPWRQNGKVVAVKYRRPGKDFDWENRNKARGLYGQWLWRDKGRMVVITEGELDALSVSEVQDNRWPVVSLPNGVGSAVKSVLEAMEWLQGFDRVVLMFDQDEVGQDAALEVAALLPPGKAYIATLPLKDASEMLQAGNRKGIIDAIWGAKAWRPDGLVRGAEIVERAMRPLPPSVSYPLRGLTEVTKGLRQSEITLFAAGSGVGKSTLFRETAFDLAKAGHRVGYIALEESVQVTAMGLLGLELGVNLRLVPDPLAVMRDNMETFNELMDSFVLYDSWGSMDPDVLANKIRYMALADECPYIFLDHVSIVVSGTAGNDERATIDRLMTQLRALAQETGIGLGIVSHIRRRPSGQKGWESGAMPGLSDLRGSGALEQLSDTVIFGARNSEASDEEERRRVIYAVGKNRWASTTGPAGSALYDLETGRLVEEHSFPAQETETYA